MGLNKKMGDVHEEYVARLMDSSVNPGSGNQWRGQMDGRVSRFRKLFAFAWDCKSTLKNSLSISRDMWQKARTQAHGERPAIPLRFYKDESLNNSEAVDLIVLDLHDFLEILEEANKPVATLVICPDFDPENARTPRAIIFRNGEITWTTSVDILSKSNGTVFRGYQTPVEEVQFTSDLRVSDRVVERPCYMLKNGRLYYFPENSGSYSVVER